MTKRKGSAAAKVLGHGYAYLQHGIDKTIEWGFRAMRSVDREEPQAKASDKSSSKIARGIRRTLGFLGTAGDAYYKKYEELKKGKGAA